MFLFDINGFTTYIFVHLGAIWPELCWKCRKTPTN